MTIREKRKGQGAWKEGNRGERHREGVECNSSLHRLFKYVITFK